MAVSAIKGSSDNMTEGQSKSSDTDTVISVNNLSKKYQLYDNPTQRLKEALHPFRKRYHHDFWALKDISFEVKKGEVLGILGRNGSGKSTLLKIITGVLTPTSGKVVVQGKVSALLELGTGFNPEYSGLENIYFSGSIMGFTKEEMSSKLDYILSFADIGEFVYQPVKTYSSGMFVRLAFALQTAVEPQVLIVDEALSVGDMFFQAKCMARLRELIEAGLTLLFVSHDLGTVRQICQRAILLHEGRMVDMGSAGEIADQYVKYQIEDRNKAAQGVLRSSSEARLQALETKLVTQPALELEPPKPEEVEIPSLNKAASGNQPADFGAEAFALRSRFNRAGNGDAEIINVQMLRNGTHSSSFDFDDEACIPISVKFNRSLRNLNLALKVRTLQGVDVLFQDTRLQDEMARIYESGKIYAFEWRIKLPLMHGSYALSCGLAHPPEIAGQDWVFVDILPIAYEFSMSPRSAGMLGGFVTLPAQLRICKQEELVL